MKPRNHENKKTSLRKTAPAKWPASATDCLPRLAPSAAPSASSGNAPFATIGGRRNSRRPGARPDNNAQGESMLTKQEKEWFDKAKAKVPQCGCTWLWCTMKCEHGEECFDIHSDFEDAAEFEARVAEKLTLKEPCPLPENAGLHDCPYSYFIEDEESAFSCRWCRLKRARIAVEQEMEECPNQ